MSNIKDATTKRFYLQFQVLSLRDNWTKHNEDHFVF